MVLLLFFLLAGANGFRFSFNSALPCGLLAVGLLALRLMRALAPIVLTYYEWAISGTLVLWFTGAAISALVNVSNETLLGLYAGYLIPIVIFAGLVKRRLREAEKFGILLAVASGALIPWLWGAVAYLNSFGFPTALDLFWNRYDASRMNEYHKVAFGNTSHMAHYIAVVLPPILLMTRGAAPSSLSRMVFIIAGVLALANLLFIFSRGAAIALLLILCFWILIFRSRRLLFLVGILGAALVIGVLQFEEVAELLSERTVGVADGAETAGGSVGTRIDSIIIGWKIFAENPFLGVGPGLTYRHNEWSIAHQFNVEEAASIGIAGLFSTVSLVLLVFARSTRAILRGPPESIAQLALWSGVLGWTIYAVLAGGLLHLGLLIPWAGLLYGFLALSISD